MINKEAVETMTQMLAVITEYSNGAHPEVETEASCENRRRAWCITKMLAKLAEHAAESDFYVLLSENVHRTDADRHRCHQVARQEDDGFMSVLGEFQARVSEYESDPVTGNDRTDSDIVLELERLLQNVRALQKLQEVFADGAGAKVTKKERERCEANLTVIAEELAGVKQQLEATEKLALTRGMVVSLNRYRTVIKRVEPALAPRSKPATAPTKAKKGPVLKLVATKPVRQPKTKTSPTKKSALAQPIFWPFPSPAK